MAQKVCFKVGESCPSPLYLNWKNDIGGWDKWLFDTRQVYSLETETLGDFEGYYDDIELQDRVIELLKRDALNIVRVAAEDLTIDEVFAMQDIFYSPRVYVLKEWNPPSAPVWTQVIADEGSKEIYVTDRTKQSIEFELRFPKKYTLSN